MEICLFEYPLNFDGRNYCFSDDVRNECVLIRTDSRNSSTDGEIGLIIWQKSVSNHRLLIELLETRCDVITWDLGCNKKCEL